MHPTFAHSDVGRVKVSGRHLLSATEFIEHPDDGDVVKHSFSPLKRVRRLDEHLTIELFEPVRIRQLTIVAVADEYH